MKRGSCWTVLVAMLMMLVFIMPSQARERVKAWAGKFTVPTYQLDPGDLNPRFQELDGSFIYPYTMQDEFTTKCISQDHRALFLENEYLKVTILPDINGRIQSVLDKTTNEEMFHVNDCIRPARIAMRGAWISGGVEWNPGPQSHTLITYEPVNTAIEPHIDGSASIVVSSTLMDSGLRMLVRVTLRPGVAVVDEQIRIQNPTDSMQPYYFWNNTSFPNNGNGTRIIWPATLITDHYGVKFTRWPINEKGVDGSYLKNYQDTAAMFTVNCVFDFFGAYNTDLDRGMVAYADHRVLPGKKCWTWGKSNYGVMRQQFLGEKNTEYIEVQSGPLPTQSDYEFLDSHRQIAWEECWYPVHGLGEGFEFCTRDVAIQTERPTGGDLKIRMLATAAFEGATVRIERDGQSLVEETADLNPKEVYAVGVPGGIGKPVRIVVKAADGKILADYKSPLEIPYEPIPKLAARPTTETAENLYLAARRLDKESERVKARGLYERALELEPKHIGSMKALAVLDIESTRYDQALERLTQALKLEPADGQSRYLASVCHFYSDRLDETLKQAYEAIRRPETRSIGWDMSGRVYMRRGETDKAIEAFRNALAADPSDLRARDHLLMSYMVKRDIPALRELADITTVDDPTNLVGWYAQTAGMKVKMAKPNLGNSDFETMQASAAFAEVGLYAEAEGLMTAIHGKNQDNRLALYWLAWLAERQNQPDRADELRRKASAAATKGSYASNPIMIGVLAEAIRNNPNDACATADLGNMLAGLGRTEEAAPLWKTAVALDPKQSVAWRNLGLYEWKWNRDLKAAGHYYAEAVKANPADQTYWRDWAQVLMQDKQPAQAVKVIDAMPPNGSKPRGDLLFTKVRADLELGRYDDAIKILESNWFTIGEFQTDSHELFVRALVARGERSYNAGKYKSALADFQKALTYPGNLGIGRRLQPAEAQQYYWIGKTFAKMGKIEEAHAAWQTGANQQAGRGSRREQGRYRRLCAEALDAKTASK